MTINKYISKAILAAGFMLALGSTSCTDDFEEINTNDKAINFENAKPEDFVLKAQWNLAYDLGGVTAPFLLTQQLAEASFSRLSKYKIEIGDGSWDDLYKSLGIFKDAERSLDFQVDINTDENSVNAYKGVIKTLQVLHWQIVTDTYGPVPFEEALDYNNETPKFQSQKEIYTKLLSEINDAIAKLKDNDGGAYWSGMSKEAYFGGDLVKWYQLANSVKLRVATRILDTDLASEAKKAIRESHDKGLEKGNDTRFTFNSTNRSPLFIAYRSRTQSGPSDVLVNKLQELNDPRLLKYVHKVSDDLKVAAYGKVNGEMKKETFSVTPFFDASYDSHPGIIFDYSESEFLVAEAFARTEVLADIAKAETHYNNAVEASILAWGGSEEEAKVYLAQDGVKFNSDKAIELIATQKWLSLYTVGHEAYAELRRLDIPKLKFAEIDGNKFPTRLIMPADERLSNPTNYNAAKQLIKGGQDVPTAKLWWDNK